MNRFSWTEAWADLPEPSVPPGHWSHPGAAVTSDDRVVLVHPAGSTIVLLDPDGRRVGSWDGEFHEAHGIAVTRDGQEDRIWIADPGFRILIKRGVQAVDGDAGRVFEYTLDGRLIRSLGEPPIPLHLVHGAPYKPTSVAGFDASSGGDGRFWVTDGYGTFLVHRYAADGTFVSSMSGEEGETGAFRNPHALHLDRRHAEPELYIADRHNSRIQVYDVDGRYKRSFGQAHLVTPTAFASHDGRLYVAELRGGIAVFDEDDQLEGYIGGEDEARPDPWPNARSPKGKLVRPRFEAGRFNSPHGLAADSRGTLYVAEFVIGGRYLRLSPQS